MGNASKIVLVGAASLIVGVYGISLKMVQGTDVGTALSHVRLVQNERVEDAAVKAALERITRAPLLGKSSTSGTVTALGGGTFQYSYTKDSTVVCTNPPFTYYYGHATLTMIQYGDTKTFDVSMQNKPKTNPGFRHILRGQWQVTKYHVRSLH